MSYFNEIISYEEREEVRQGANRFNEALNKCEYYVRVLVLVCLIGGDKMPK